MSFFKKFFAKGPSHAEQQLSLRCRGDSELIERLISYELSRRPFLSRAAASQAALERWQRDR